MNLQWPNIRIWIIAVLIAGVTVAVWYGIRVEQQVQLRFQASQSSFPSRIYARAPVLYRGMDIIETALAQYLDRLGYRVASRPEVRMGEYVTGTDEWIIGVRPFVHANGREEGRKVIVQLDGNGRIAKLSNQTGQELRTVRIEPAEIGAFIPADGKDRIRVNMEDVPEHLVNAILVNEDRRFFDHSGIDLRRIAGALYANLRSGKVVQGASTVTQQLVKSIYLSRDRTLERKVLEMFIALMLERRHGKQEILEAYLNELYLGQDGAVAIHGVALAAKYYFGKDIRDLNLAESALLQDSSARRAGMRHFAIPTLRSNDAISSSTRCSSRDGFRGLNTHPPANRHWDCARLLYASSLPATSSIIFANASPGAMGTTSSSGKGCRSIRRLICGCRNWRRKRSVNVWKILRKRITG